VAVVVVTVLWCGPATADVWHYVSDWVDLTWNVRAVEAYEDNVTNGSSGKEGDFVTTLGFDSRLILHHPVGRFTLFYRFDQNLYLDHSELNDVGSTAGLGQNQAISFGDTLHLSPRDILTYSNAFSRTPDALYTTGSTRASQRQPVDLEGVVVGHQGVIKNVTTLGYRHDFTFPVIFDLNSSYDLYEYDDPLLIDSRAASLGAGVSWRLSALRSIGLHYGHTVNRFDSFDGSDSDVVSVVYGDQPTATLNLSASLGASFNSTSDNAVNDVTPDLDVRLTKTVKRGNLTAAYRQRVSTSRGFGGTSEQKSVRLGGSYNHSPIWTSSLSASFSERRSKRVAGRDTRRVTVRYSTGYPLGRLLNLTGGYLYSRQRESGINRNGTITNNRVWIGLRYGATLL